MASTFGEPDPIAQLSIECEHHDLTILVVLDKPDLAFPDRWDYVITFEGQMKSHFGIGKSRDEAQRIASRFALSWIEEHFGNSKTGEFASTPAPASDAINNTLSIGTTLTTGSSVDSTRNTSTQNTQATNLFSAAPSTSAPPATTSTTGPGSLFNPPTSQLQSPFLPRATEPGLAVSRGGTLDTKTKNAKHTAHTLPNGPSRSLFGENNMSTSRSLDHKYPCPQGCTGGLFCSHRYVAFTNSTQPQQPSGSLFGTSGSTSSSLFGTVQPRPCPQGCTGGLLCSHRTLAPANNAQPPQRSSSLFGGSGPGSLFGPAKPTPCPQGCSSLFCNHRNVRSTNNTQPQQEGSSLFGPVHPPSYQPGCNCMHCNFRNAGNPQGSRPPSSSLFSKLTPIPATASGVGPSSNIASQPSNNSQQPASLFGQAATTSTVDNPSGNAHAGVSAACFGHTLQNISSIHNGTANTTSLFSPVRVSPDSSTNVVPRFRNVFAGASSQNMDNLFRHSIQTTQQQQELNRFSSSVPVPSMDKLFPQSYVNQSTSVSKTAEKNIGTAMVPFRGNVVREYESLAGQVLYLSIGSQPEYQRFCPEELRLADYTQGHRYPEARGSASQTTRVINPASNFPPSFFPNPLPATDSGAPSKNQPSLTISSVAVPNAVKAGAITHSWIANEHVMIRNKYFTPDKSVTFATSMLASGPEPLHSITINELHRPASFKELQSRLYEELQALSELFLIDGPEAAKQWITEAKKYIQAQHEQWNATHLEEGGEAIDHRLIPSGGIISRMTPPHLPEIILPQFGRPAPQSAIIARATTLLNDICEIICNQDTLLSRTTEEWLSTIDSFFAVKLVSSVTSKDGESSSTDEESGSGFDTPESETAEQSDVSEAERAAMVPLPAQLGNDISGNGTENETGAEGKDRSVD